MSSSIEQREPTKTPAETPLADGDSANGRQPGLTDHYVPDSERTVIRASGQFDIEHRQMIPPSLRESVGGLVGQQIDHFQIESLIGTGGMGAVFRGRDLRLDRVVAIKVVPIADRGADAMRRFRVEAQSAAKLDHPNIARVYYVG
jgi:serine/threonine protein kinase